MPKRKSKYLYERISPRNAAIFIIIATLLISGGAAFAYFGIRAFYRARALDPKYHILSILQEGKGEARLETDALAEILELSQDHPTNIYLFDQEQAKKKLLNYPVISFAEVRRVKPSTISINYNTREPIAFLPEFENTAIDQSGVYFPYRPFFEPKKLPEIYLGNERAESGLEILDWITKNCCDETLKLCLIDISCATSTVLGKREIVVCFEERFDKLDAHRHFTYTAPRYLRLPAKEWKKALQRFLKLRPYLFEHQVFSEIDPLQAVICCPPILVDLRLKSSAIFQTVESI
ncbi:MAG: FtsQ-type POTRA domain-containing protein [Waddliaceae bacterium]